MKRALSLLTSLADDDSRIVLLVGDLGYHLFEEFEQKHPDRFFNCGIMEQNMIGVAAGMAKRGKIPFVYSIATFVSLRCLEQIKIDVCYNNAKIIILSGGAGFNYGNLGATHHSLNAVSCLQSLPGINVYVPGDRFEAEASVIDAYQDRNASYISLGRSSGKDGFVLSSRPQNIRVPSLVFTGTSSIVILSCGPLLAESLTVAKNMNATLFSLPLVTGLDRDFVKALAQKYDFIVTVEENVIIGGFGSVVSQIVASSSRKSKVLNLGVPLSPDVIVGDHEYLKEKVGLSSPLIQEQISRFVKCSF